MQTSRLALLLIPALLLPWSLSAQVPSPPAGETGLTLGSGVELEHRLELKLPADPAVRSGRLENGVRYLVRENPEPEGRAFLRLVVDAGSILETEQQLGLAHFVEHMAFNGTEDFAKEEIVAYLESLGMRFGPDVNAYTSFDETVYMLQLPTDDPGRLERAFHILENWAHKVSFEPAEVERERGVILEEWRVGLGAQTRLRDAQFPVLFQNSRYAERLPIGKPEVFMNAPREELLNFYTTWYRPELMSVIAVGDFDADVVEQHIRQFFAAVPARPAALPRPTFEMPEHEETLFAVASDPEAPRSVVAMYTKRPPNRMRTGEDYRSRLVDILYAMMMNERFSDLARSADAPFLQAGAATGRIVRPTDVHLLQALTEDGGITRGLAALVRETRRVALHGFSEAELQRALRRLERSMRDAYNERKQTPSDRYMAEYTAHVLRGEAIPGIAYEYALTQQLLPGISLYELNARAEQLLADRNRVLLVSVPERDGVRLPDNAELARVLQEAGTAPVEPWSTAASERPLLESPPEPGTVRSELFHHDAGVSEWTLSNGARVVWKSTDYRSDEVQFSAFAEGGTTFAGDDRVLEARRLRDLFAQSGVAGFTQTELERVLAGSSVQLDHRMESVTHGFTGRSSAEDLETLLQLIHLQITKPRLDQQSFETFLRREEVSLRNRLTQPDAIFQDRLFELLSPGNERSRPFRAEMLAELDRERALELYHDLYGHAGAFTFIFVGNLPEKTEFTKLVERYLASLPNRRPAPRFEDRRTPRPDTRVEETIRAGLEEAARIAVLYHGEYNWSQEQNHLLGTIADLLRLQLRERVRERESGTYSVGVQRSLARYPAPEYILLLSFGADPAQLDRLSVVVEEEVALLAGSTEIAERYLARVQETQRREHEQDLRSNSFWRTSLDFSYRHKRPPGAVLATPDLINAVDAESVRQAAARYLLPERLILLKLYPGDSPEPVRN